jgi:uncharacterized membrane protein YgcG
MIDWFVFHSHWYWGWILLWVLITAVLVKWKPARPLAWVSFAFLLYAGFVWYCWNWVSVIFWILWVLGLVWGLFLFARNLWSARTFWTNRMSWAETRYTRYRAMRHGVYVERNAPAVLAGLIAIAIMLSAIGAFVYNEAFNHAGTASPSATVPPTPGATTTKPTPSGTTTPSTTPTLSDADKRQIENYKAQAKTSYDNADQAAAEAAASAKKNSAAAKDAKDAQAAADNAEKEYNNAAKATDVQTAKIAATNAATYETDAVNARNRAATAAAGTSSGSGSSGSSGNGTSGSSFAANDGRKHVKYADSLLNPLANMTHELPITLVEKYGVMASSTGYGLNVYGHMLGGDLTKPFPVLKKFDTVDKANQWLKDCTSGATSADDCVSDMKAIGAILRDPRIQNAGVVASASVFNVQAGNLGFDPSTWQVNKRQESKNKRWVAFKLNLKTPVCFGFNVEDARFGILATCAPVTVSTHSEGKGSGSTTKTVTRVHTHKVTHHTGKGGGTTVKHHCGCTHQKPPKPHCGCKPPTVCKPHGTEPTGGPHHWSTKLCVWVKDKQSHDSMRDGGTAGAKQQVGDNHTSGVDTGKSTDNPEPSKNPVHTGSDTPANNGTGHDSGGGTGTSPGGTSTGGGSSSTGGTSPTGPADNSGQGGPGNGSDPGGF